MVDRKLKNKGGQNKRLESKKGSHKNEAEVKNDRDNLRKEHKKIILRGYGDEGNKLRRMKSREMRSRNKRWTKGDGEKRSERTKEREEKMKIKVKKKIQKARDRGKKA